jgi:PKHD-type hydroxylase
MWRGALDPKECRDVIATGQTKEMKDATIRVSDTDSDYRRSKVSWLKQDDIPWLYEKLEFIAQQLNGQFFGFDLWGFDEDIQYTEYHAEDEGFYDWHQDHFTSIENNIDLRRPRKLSLTIQLSDAKDYEGGELLINNGRIQETPKGQGTAIAFPSWQVHKVNPVTKGTRRSLVVWICGPHFR